MRNTGHLVTSTSTPTTPPTESELKAFNEKREADLEAERTSHNETKKQLADAAARGIVLEGQHSKLFSTQRYRL